MTGQALLAQACALFFDSNTAYYEPYAAAQIGTLLADTFDCNNGLRIKAGKAALDAVPDYTSLADEIPYEALLIGRAFGYGLASKLYFDDNDPGRQAYFYQQYLAAVGELTPIRARRMSHAAASL